jgi:hypothetical protein
MKNPPMRMLILLAVFWAAGTLLLAAESPSTPKPAATATKTTDAAKTDAAKTDAAKTDAAKTDASASGDKDSGKDSGTASSKGSIAEQAEAALKAAAETDAGGASKAPPPKSDAEDSEQHANDDTQTPPTGKGPSPQRFVPTEQVRADFDVSFPIDI